VNYELGFSEDASIIRAQDLIRRTVIGGPRNTALPKTVSGRFRLSMVFVAERRLNLARPFKAGERLKYPRRVSDE